MLRHRVNHYTDEFDQSCARVAVAVAAAVAAAAAVAVAVAVAVYCAIGTGRDDSQNGALLSPSDDRQLIQRYARSLRLKLSASAIK